MIDANTLRGFTLGEILYALSLASDLAEKLRGYEEDEWMTADEACAYLKLKPDNFRRRAAAGQIPRHPLTGERSGYRYHRPELREWGLARKDDLTDT